MTDQFRKTALAMGIAGLLATFTVPASAQPLQPTSPSPTTTVDSTHVDPLIADYEAVDTDGPSVMVGVDLAFTILGGLGAVVGVFGGLFCSVAGGLSGAFGSGSSSSNDCGAWWGVAAAGGATVVVSTPLWIAGLVWLGDRRHHRNHLREEIEAEGGSVALRATPWASRNAAGLQLSGTF